jgi:hypothetical protein
MLFVNITVAGANQLVMGIIQAITVFGKGDKRLAW